MVAGIGMAMPGVDGWEQGRKVLQQDTVDLSLPLPAMAKNLLPANERRRTTPLIQMALHVAEQALQGRQGDFSSVFASSCGDLAVVDKIMSALTMPGRPVSPIQFHNSVHNAPAGYWSILTGSNMPSTSISAWDESFSVGLVEALSQLLTEHQSVLLVSYDLPGPQRLRKHRPVCRPFALAMMLSTRGRGFSLELSVEMDGARVSTMDTPAWEHLRQDNPAARALPLLQLLARGKPGSIFLPYTHGQSLRVELKS
ncbi:conserved hypothetical protein [Thiolapillus brandeum]|uniref:Beta-ketoacyl synthase-like N-terminal domain-containing protein n=1 Tax=Thiolapillus brandeum TaxID=1076588 RepID=A0A7U6GI56_9GAMM|nr:conserved hypothetical protein [Thiolapillus brandeum]